MKQVEHLEWMDDGSTKGKILEAATTEFAEFGTGGARVDRIARMAGVNKAMIYYHFRSKEDLYRTVINAYLERASQLIVSGIDQSHTLEQFLLAVADTYAEIFRRVGPFRSILLRELAVGESEFVERIARVLSETALAQTIAARIQQGINDGTLREVDVRQAVFSFIAMNIGFMLLSPLAGRILKVTDTDRFVEDRKRAVVDLFLHGVKARPE